MIAMARQQKVLQYGHSGCTWAQNISSNAKSSSSIQHFKDLCCVMLIEFIGSMNQKQWTIMKIWNWLVSVFKSQPHDYKMPASLEGLYISVLLGLPGPLVCTWLLLDCVLNLRMPSVLDLIHITISGNLLKLVGFGRCVTWYAYCI